jgi:hypothetical protein
VLDSGVEEGATDQSLMLKGTAPSVHPPSQKHTTNHLILSSTSSPSTSSFSSSYVVCLLTFTVASRLPAPLPNPH